MKADLKFTDNHRNSVIEALLYGNQHVVYNNHY